ncbi:MAG TPA: cytochrome c biogenesis protein CcsA [Bacteroidales bacterium]|nr:cytochrome c biogenesis protein CcsA [Bacteroidales bacterium]
MYSCFLLTRKILILLEQMLKRYWWKILAGVLLLYAVVAGFLVEVPDTMIRETMRNLFYHVGMWFGMFILLTIGFIYSIRYLLKFREEEDLVAVESVNVGLLFGILGILTGMVWASFTWGSPWVKDPKLNGAALGIFIYLAYLILRGSIGDPHKKAKVSAVYNILAYVLWIVFVMIMPRMAGESIHPGKDTSPVLPMHLEPSLRIVFYPAMLGWILLGIWIMNLRVRFRRIRMALEE